VYGYHPKCDSETVGNVLDAEEVEDSSQNDRTLCPGLSRSPRRAGTRLASLAAAAACVALLCTQFCSLIHPSGKLFLSICEPFSVMTSIVHSLTLESSRENSLIHSLPCLLICGF
jgi:hypothetical protein